MERRRILHGIIAFIVGALVAVAAWLIKRFVEKDGEQLPQPTIQNPILDHLEKKARQAAEEASKSADMATEEIVDLSADGVEDAFDNAFRPKDGG